MPKQQKKIPAGAEAAEILHITDIHAGPKAYTDEDNKERIGDAKRVSMLERLNDYISDLPKRPDYVVVSGDMTIAGDPDGMRQVRDWLVKGIASGILPPAECIVVMPGNHDVDRMTDPRAGTEHIFDTFSEVFGKGFPHAFLPLLDPKHPLPPLDSGKDVIGGIKTKRVVGGVELVKSWPFLLDLKKKLLIYAFNSSLGCGTFLPLDQELEKYLDFFGGLAAPAPSHADEIRKRYRSSRLIDAPLVGEAQLRAFAKTMKHLQDGLGDTYAHLTKIATLHHHVSHLWRQQMEAKSFESIIDAAQVKQVLIDHQFDMVLHGHKHQNHISLDSQIIPISRMRSMSPLCIVSGGTTGVHPRMGDRPTFKVISLKGGRRPRADAVIREIPLLPGMPRRVMEDDAKVYQVPLAAGAGDLHDLSQLKSGLDELVFGKAAGSRLKAKGTVVHQMGQVRMPVPDPAIVSEGSTYEFFRVISAGGKRTFVDIFQADRRLGFRQKARIHWMLSDVKGLNGDSPGNDVFLVVANLEATHFSRSNEPGEIADSIAELKKFFAPAIRNGLLEIKVCNVAQKEIDGIGKKLFLDRKPEAAK